MSNSETTINVNGSCSQSIRPELCEVSFRVAANSVNANEALTKVTETTNKITSMLRDLAPHKADTMSAALALDAEPPIVDDFPVTKWSMQRLRKWSSKDRVTDETSQSQNMAVAARSTFTTTTTYRDETRHYVNTTLNATFHDFDKLELFVSTIMREPNVEIDNLEWTVTSKTRANFVAAVRAGAVTNALAKARDYASALPSAGANLRVVEINDHSNEGGHMVYRAAAAAKMNFADTAEQEPLSFEPESVKVSANVAVKVVL